MSISYEETKSIMGREPDDRRREMAGSAAWAAWLIGGLFAQWSSSSSSISVSVDGFILVDTKSTTQLRHLLAGLGVREWDGGEDQGDSATDLLRLLRELCAVLSGFSQEQAILRIDDEGEWSAECHNIEGLGYTPEAACRDAIRDARASLAARADIMESRAAELRRLAEGGA